MSKMTCDHDVTDREVAAVADGLCPLCLHGMTMRQSLEIELMRKALEAVRDTVLMVPDKTMELVCAALAGAEGEKS